MTPFGARADTLYKPGDWPALAGDRVATATGDTLTVIVYENASAQNAAQNDSRRRSDVDGQIVAGSAFSERGQLGLGGAFESGGQTGRSGRMVAQLSVTVEEVLPNGDLRIAGRQSLKINGENTVIRLRGRVRRVDISPANAIISSRIADAEIDYDGKGFVSSSARPGILAKIFNFLGL
ncbi:hypothetical protein NX02_19985 [Sphingomonas sanxanigenens DSM 19645 = NX02]|uniref:Basal body L-ring protein n=2 Tax=Sphingomonas sanxanigenens TaxID=397260 RepID=W0AEX9_9SPHN|nr:hypothetical protein NX02_19985 [Sphingomonas sanxanigenens DSM 19645 = NX02]